MSVVTYKKSGLINLQDTFNLQEEERKTNKAILKCKRQEAAGFKLMPI